MKHVITVLNISVGPYSMRTNSRVEKGSFYFETDNLLIRQLNNCSLGGVFESRAMPKYVNLIALLYELILKEHVVVIMEFPDWVQVKKIYILWISYAGTHVPMFVPRLSLIKVRFRNLCTKF